ncbi:MAG: AMP-binding protein [Treponema sp.]|jgi:long-chain acyl-CoA synthetase|nr:AMP-binding protein [Treponema sp.]
MNTVIELLHEAARRHGDIPYLGGKTGDRWVKTGFKEADKISDAFALSLLKLGFTGKTVSIMAEGRPSWVLAEFGILKAGCTSVPLSTKLLPDEVIFRLDHSESEAFLVSENYFRKGADVLDRVQKKPVLICISPKTEKTDELAEEFSLTAGRDLLYYDDLVLSGLALLDASSNGASTGNASGDSGAAALRAKLAEIEKRLDTDDTVTISYTSGTTGNPKGIMLTHRNYLHNALNAIQVVHIDRGWKTLIMLPLDHSFAHTVGLYMMAEIGAAIYFPDSQGGPLAAIRNLPANLAETNPDFLLTVPALSGNFMRKMIQGVRAKGNFIYGIFDRGVKAGIRRAGNGYNKPPLGRRIASFFPWALANALVFPKLRKFFGTDLKFCIGGGALLEIRQQEFFNAIGAPVYQGYGLTENAPVICTNAPQKHKFGTSGIIIPNLDVRIMKDDEHECAAGETGQIVTRGGSVMKGYFKNPDATRETLRDAWLWSGDLGYIDRDGFLVVTGREKALLIAADGEKYSPETIEEAVMNTSHLINQMMAYNEQCRFTSAVITLNAEEFKAAVCAAGLDAVDGTDKIIDLVRDDLGAFAAHQEYSGIPAQWRPASFAIIPGMFGEDNGLINSTMKLVRHKVRNFYRSRIDEIYAESSANPHTRGNRDAVRKILGS